MVFEIMIDRTSSTNSLFGGKLGWNSGDWTDSDDRVRGGRSQSNFKIEHHRAMFYGHLDIDALGGAGFASQRTTGDDRSWDLSEYDGIELIFDPSGTDEKTYTFILKDELLPQDPISGRERSTVSWEFDFDRSNACACGDQPRFSQISIPWTSLRPTYRGKPKVDATPLSINDVKRMSIMMRSFFGTQKGDFSLTLLAIRGIIRRPSSKATLPDFTPAGDDGSSAHSLDKPTEPERQISGQSIWSRLFCWSHKL